MNATTDAPTQSAASPQVTSAEIEASGAVPILLLFFGAAVWLLLATFLALICSVKFHAPSLLASHAMLTYGRLHAAADTALLYGFGVPAALASSLWLLCRQGRARLAGPAAAVIGALAWNTAVAGCLWGILRGAGTGYEALEIPHGLAPMLLFAYVLIGICGIITFHHRQPGMLYPSQWFVVGALFWFAWIFSTAAMLLLFFPVRGVLQASVDWWYENNLGAVFFGFAGLAPIFYFIPKLTRRPLHSHYLGAFAFWLLAWFGSCGGMINGAPLPSWIIGVSVVGTVFTIIPILAVAMNLYLTARDALPTVDCDPSLRFLGAALIFWIIAGVQQVVGALPSVGSLTNFTWFIVAQHDLFRYGFFAMAMFGAAYYIVPRLADPKSNAPEGLWREGWINAHFWLTLAGVFIGYVSLLVAGLWQGVALDNAGNSFISVMKSTLMALRMSTLAPLLLLVGTFIFLLNFTLLLKECCARCCREHGCCGKTSKEGA
jgi:cytochrome c oxidase cbb3-type subunit I